MKFRKQLLAVSAVLVALFLTGCIAQKTTAPQGTDAAAPPQATEAAPQATDLAKLKTPTKQILVTAGDFNKPYDILGEVECTLDGKSVYAQTDMKEVNLALNKVAFAKYGDKVDAIINTNTVEGTNGGYFGAVAAGFGAPVASVSAHGIAVHFK